MSAGSELPTGGGDTPAPSVIRPNRSVWVLPSGQVVDVETEGQNEDASAFSHGISAGRIALCRVFSNNPLSQSEQARATWSFS